MSTQLQLWLHQNHKEKLHKENIHLPFPLWGKLMQCPSCYRRNSKLLSKLSVFPHYLPVSGNIVVVQKNVEPITESLIKQQQQQQQQQKKQKLVPHEVSLDRFVTFFTSIKHVSLTVMASAECIYVCIKYLKSKLKIQNCHVENNMKMILQRRSLSHLSLC